MHANKPKMAKKWEKEEAVNESRADVLKAIKIAKSMGGNMSGAVKKIEKIQKGLSKQIEVEDALRTANESVNEVQKRQATDIAVKFDKAYLNYSREIRDIIKMVVKITGNNTDGKIFNSAYKKHLIPFDALFKSWYRGQQNNPHIDEEKKRDYKAEYKKFQSSTKSKKYRAELNKYNRKKGTYGNGDGKDASHKGGKIVGFVSQSKNRGRAEKSRMKKEVSVTESDLGLTYKKGKTVKVKHKTSGKQLVIVDKPNVRKEYEKIGFFAEAQVNELVPNMAVINQPAYKQMLDKRVGDVKIKTALANKDHKDHKKAKSIAQRVRDKIKNMMSKKKDDKSKKPKKQSKSDTDFYKRQFTGETIIEINGVKYAPVEEGFGGQLKGKDKQKFEKARKENAEVLGYKLTGKSDINEVKSKIMKAIGSIIGKKQAKKINGVLVDMQTAHVIMKVWNALNTSNRNKFEKMPIQKMAVVAWKLVK